MLLMITSSSRDPSDWRGRGPKPSDSGFADISNYVRCVSRAFHNLVGTLYQGGKHGPAVRFLKQGCTLGVKALNMHHVGGVSEDGGGNSWICPILSTIPRLCAPLASATSPPIRGCATEYSRGASCAGSMTPGESTTKAYRKLLPKQGTVVKKATRRVGDARRAHVELVTPKPKPRKGEKCQ
jgi:hypothetical protein